MNPSPSQIKKARHLAGLTQSQAAKLCCVTLGGYQHWEYGVRKMSESTWELFEIKCAMRLAGAKLCHLQSHPAKIVCSSCHEAMHLSIRDTNQHQSNLHKLARTRF